MRKVIRAFQMALEIAKRSLATLDLVGIFGIRIGTGEASSSPRVIPNGLTRFGNHGERLVPTVISRRNANVLVCP